MQRLPASETEVMLALWQAEEPVPRSWLDERLKDKGWNANTVNTYLTRLEDKGFVESSRAGRANLYRPLVSREEYQAYEGSSVLNKLYNKSLKSFVASLVGAEAVEQEELDELQRYLDILKGGEGNA